MSYVIRDIYTRYQIPPWLQMHMQRVAAVAATLFDARKELDGLQKKDRDGLICACLLHDMGNIIKFNFDKLALFPPSERDHWDTVRSTMIARYGRDAHVATLAIMDEIGVSSRVRKIVDTVDFAHADTIARSNDRLVQIVQYADSRVIPTGIGSLADRMKDMFDRYSHLHDSNSAETHKQIHALEEIERLLFEGTALSPEDITEASCAETARTLLEFSIC